MANNRIFYACQLVAIAQENSTSFKEVHGVQSVGLNTTFNLEQAFELGQISIYENIEGIPDVEMTLEKVIDGYPLIYIMATSGADNNTLVSRTKKRCNALLGIYPDDQTVVSGAPSQQVFMSGMYVNNITYTFPTDGNCTESVTLVGNHKIWNEDTYQVANVEQRFRYGSDYPSGLGGIQRRENVKMSNCIIPSSIINSYGIVVGPDAGNNNNNGNPIAHIQSITLSVDLGREDILELGRRSPYYKAPNFPVEVTSEFEVISISGDRINAYEHGDPNLFNDPRTSGNNTIEEKIKIALEYGVVFDLGSKNRLSSITFGGGDAGGGNASMTFSYSNFNDFTISGVID